MEKPRKKGLLPCPFCDSDAVLYGSNITTGFGVYCSKIECGVNIYDMYTKDGEQYATMRSKEDAIKAWNTRAMSTWLEGEVPSESDIYMKLCEKRLLQNDAGNIVIEFHKYNQHLEDLSKAINKLLTRKLTGKV